MSILGRHLSAFGGVFAFAALAAPNLHSAIVFQHLPEVLSPHVSHHNIGGPVLADDFDPSGLLSGPVTGAVWWGSAAQSTSWEITLHTGAVGGGGFGVPQVNPAFTGGIKVFVTATGSDPDGDGIFRYSADLPGTFSIQAGPRPFGSEYWFSVANGAAGWTWAYAGSGPTIGDEHWSGVVSTGSTPCGDSGPHCGAWSQIQGRDFAFQLEAVPEPGSWVLLVSGVILVGLGRLAPKRN